MPTEFADAENDFLLLAAVSPIVFGTFLVVAVRRLRLHKRTGLAFLFLGNSLVVLFLGSLCVLGGELYFRFVCDTTDNFAMSKLTWNWFLRHYASNVNGFRDSVDYHARKFPNMGRRITFIGDSFTAGHGVDNVEDRFANRLRAQWNGVEVHAMATCGWDTGEQLSYIEYLIDSGYEFDVVVLVYVLNDAVDISPEVLTAEEQFRSRHRNPGFPWSHSYLLNTIYFHGVVSHAPLVRNYDRMILHAYEGNIWQAQKERLRKIRDLVESQGGVFLTVTFPYLHGSGTDDDVSRVHREIADFWQSLGVKHLDLREVFEPLESEELVVNRFDAHPNEKSHAIAADAIGRFVADALQTIPLSATE